ncbi:serine protease [Microtetraspora sp. NBRC 13810]|uniref:S8 family peptidase n=1 Tax=Microtetraspora sp. NBRC 13810 TaxID=3030990 RepID=UPI0024A12C07|nr:S8 family serine peptidase [Microtetraspora sp. NBRC 13810]GLW12240.1 serine protease [Microtetraspora sp. NBRC 13810]
MWRRKRSLGGALTAVALALTGSAAVAVPAEVTGPAGTSRDYMVFYTAGAQDRAESAIRSAGGRRVSAGDPRLGYVIASGPGTAFVEALGRSDAIAGVSANRKIGSAAALPTAGLATRATVDRKRLNAPAPAGQEPLAPLQWDMKLIGATAGQSYKKAPGDKRVLVGVIDTGIDGKHPDIAPNFDRALSRNFVTDTPKDPKGNTQDGPCEYKGCKDPVDVDGEGHGTHVASTIAAPINGLGIAGVAPKVTLVNLRAGTDAGLFFLKPSLDALAYAADAGIDVVNMSYYIDPWLFNCPANPSDSKAQQLEQQGIITGMQRALDYARSRGVTLISAIGNNSTDLGRPTRDSTSPDYPSGEERDRKIDNSCLNVPAESKGVISISSVGPSELKAYYSDYGIEQTDLAAPGGDDFSPGSTKSDIARTILGAAPEQLLRAQGLIDKNGKPKTTAVVRDCKGSTCAYYQYLQGTSMAAPHATGVAAILISRFGKPDNGGLSLAPATVERLLYETAVRKGCPASGKQTYSPFGIKDTQACQGDQARNGFYGHGIVDAERAATVTK